MKCRTDSRATRQKNRTCRVPPLRLPPRTFNLAEGAPALLDRVARLCRVSAPYVGLANFAVGWHLPSDTLRQQLGDITRPNADGSAGEGYGTQPGNFDACLIQLTKRFSSNLSCSWMSR